ncbi:hypothetical protein [Tranquillimonas alkanivorans]|uniref:Uncharacterized protein n=1 Tax=Tranquillimonas alkanivorans TaxID=441119 RepID=A0A1I5V524_9RHOB|nr:hypothetical protein [Tranquillimonas alkanivorans]SFQ02653.1 hypothetical protein SAMN04488047_12726 [Tranquillimonas alkanivorans]
MRQFMQRTAKFNVSGIVVILVAVTFTFGTLLDLPIPEHPPYYPTHEALQVQAAPLQGVLAAAAVSHCQDNVGCHAAVIPAALPMSGAGLAGASPMPAREIAASDHLGDLFRPPPQA